MRMKEGAVMSEKVSITVNGIKRTVEIEGWERVIDVLRDYLDLTGTKRGCDDVSCGACTIVINNEAKKSCSLSAKKLMSIDNPEIVTIEGISDGLNLHPIQQALIDAGAVQCGFCMPGIAMKLYALFNRNINASEEEIIEELSDNFCRCTGYETVLEGALLAQKRMKG